MTTTDYIEQLTCFAASQQQHYVLYYAKLPPTIREHAHDRQRDIAATWANKHRAGSLDCQNYDVQRQGANSYAALLLALSEIQTADNAIARGRKVDADVLALCDRIRKARETEKLRHNRPTPKRDYILTNMDLIIELREQHGESWRQISKHRLFDGKVTHVLLQQTYIEEMKNRDLRGRLALTEPKAVQMKLFS